MQNQPFANFPLDDFWEDANYAVENYVGAFPDDEMIASIEKETGYKLPASYIHLMRIQNGGIPVRCSHPSPEPTFWSQDHISITGIMGIGRDRPYSICGEMGSAFMISEWGYPADGIYFATCPTGGHNMVLLDYSHCGNSGEPEVVFVDQDMNYKKTLLAKDFESFIRGLVPDAAYDDLEE